ncbi:MAG: hypothetical protein GY737_30610 [Desulfobacteraceae bacterium]|nr:hypothetical protein [Desulfobacteraceae bacterium]
MMKPCGSIVSSFFAKKKAKNPDSCSIRPSWLIIDNGLYLFNQQQFHIASGKILISEIRLCQAVKLQSWSWRCSLIMGKHAWGDYLHMDKEGGCPDRDQDG